MPILAASLALLAAPAPGAQHAPAGYRSFENRLSPIRFYYPVAYTELPLPPTETVLQARYLRVKPPKELTKAEKRAYKGQEVRLVAFYFEQRVPTTPAAGAGEQEPRKPKAPKTIREAMEAGGSVASFAEFREKRLRGWKVEADAKARGRFLLSFVPKSGFGKPTRVGWLIEKAEGGKVFGLYGHTFPSHFKRLKRELEKMAWGLGLRRVDRAARAETVLDRFYAKKDLEGIARRKEVRRDLAKGWKALDTPNYILVYDTRDAVLVKKIARDIEAMRKVYEERFAAAGEIDAVSIVRICKNLEEYRQYGGPPGTGGYWHPGNEELVFFDYDRTQREMSRRMSDREKRKRKKKLSDKDAYLVLYHEAFHQYVFYAIGSFRPHDWFNEGYGDYFSGAIIPGQSKTVARIGPSPWRVNRAQDQCEYGEGFVPLAKLLKAERAEFYHPAKRANYYVAAWSFVYFLNTAKEARAHARWSKLLPAYFDALKRFYAAEVGVLGREPTLADKRAASKKARAQALREAMHGIDLAKLERAWRGFVVKMKNPFKRLRKKHDPDLPKWR